MKLTFIIGNTSPTMKFVLQFTSTAIDIAAGRGPCENNSAVINHGIDPVFLNLKKNK